MAQEDGSRNTIAYQRSPIVNKGVNSLLEDQHCAHFPGDQQLPDHHPAETGPIMIPVGVLTENIYMSKHCRWTHR